MNKTFTFGIITGITSLAIAVPLLAGVVGAEETDTTAKRPFMQRELTQDNVQALIERDETFLANADDAMGVQKNATIAHRDALQDAVSIDDADERNDAVRAAQEVFHDTMQAYRETHPGFAPAMHLGMGRGMHNGMGMRGEGPMHAEMLEKLGMTEEEFDAALESGKTPHDIMEEQGIDMPTGQRFGNRQGMMRGGMFYEEDSL